MKNMPQVCSFLIFRGFFCAQKEGGNRKMEVMEKERVVTEVADGISFSVEHEVIMNALLLCEKVVPRQSTIPILQCVKFDLKGDTLFVTAMDTTQSVLQMLKVVNQNKMDGSYLFPAREGIKLVKRMPHGSLSFTQKGSSVCISYGERGSANLKTLDPEEFPQLPRLATSEFISVPIDVLRKGALSARFASTNETTPILCGVNVYNAGGKLAFVATDRHRIYRYISNVAIENEENFRGGVIDAQHFKGVVDALQADKVDLCINDTHLVLREKNIVYFGRLLDGTYPNIEHIFGVKTDFAIQIPRGALDECLNRMLSLETENNRVTLEASGDGELVVHSHSETGEVSEMIPGSKMSSGLPAVKFNGRYLREALLVGDREVKTVTLRISGPITPGFVEYDGDTSVTSVINPVR
jgi:DNA polymerase-3 subunit beta